MAGYAFVGRLVEVSPYHNGASTQLNVPADTAAKPLNNAHVRLPPHPDLPAAADGQTGHIAC